MDLIDIVNQLILQDLKLAFATVKILFIAESTEDIPEGKTTVSKKNITGCPGAPVHFCFRHFIKHKA